MSRAAGTPATVPLDAYLAAEARAAVRHEYVEGFVHAMTGASKRHNVIAGNVYVALRAAARAAGCRAYIEGVRLHLPGRVYYPDVLVACGPPCPDPGAEVAPTVVVEVLSESTWQVDRREKRAAYCAAPSLRHYLAVAQDERWVEHHWRDDAGAWRVTVHAGGEAIALGALGTALALDALYEGVEPDPPAQRLRLREAALAYG